MTASDVFGNLDAAASFVSRPQVASEIWICDPNPILADQLRFVLESDDRISARFSVSRTMDSLARTNQISPDILVFDPLQDLFGQKNMLALSNAFPRHTALIGYCSNIAPTDARALMSSGFRAVIPKTIESTELVRVVSVVSLKGSYLHEIYRDKEDSTPTQQKSRPQASLTAREIEVLRQVAFGDSLKEIATVLKLSTKTVDTYKTRASGKLGLKSRSDIVRYAIQSGWML